MTHEDALAVDRVLSALSGFTTAQDVARRFLELGIRGVRRACSECPVAEYLNRVLGAGYCTTVGTYNVIVERPDRRHVMCLQLPFAFTNFVSAFDRGDWTALGPGSEALREP